MSRKKVTPDRVDTTVLSTTQKMPLEVFFLRSFGGAKVQEVLNKHLHLRLFGYTLMEQKIPLDLWTEAVNYAADATDAAFNCPGLVERRHFLDDAPMAIAGYTMANRSQPEPKKAPYMVEFERFCTLVPMVLDGDLDIRVVEKVAAKCLSLGGHSCDTLLEGVRDTIARRDK